MPMLPHAGDEAGQGAASSAHVAQDMAMPQDRYFSACRHIELLSVACIPVTPPGCHRRHGMYSHGCVCGSDWQVRLVKQLSGHWLELNNAHDKLIQLS